MSAASNIEKSASQLREIGVDVDSTLLEKIVNALGIANQTLDASLVSATDENELATVRHNFIEKKLGVSEGAEEALAETMEQLSAFNHKQRGAVYYLLTKRFGKESVYLG